MFRLHNLTVALSTVVLLFCPAYCSNNTGTPLSTQLVQTGHGTVGAMSVQTQDQSDQSSEDRSCCFQAALPRNQLYGNISDNIAD